MVAPGNRHCAVALAGTAIDRRVPPGEKRHATENCPAGVGKVPEAWVRPPDGGATDTTVVGPCAGGAWGTMPSRASCMATRAEEPHPCDMLSPMRSLGVHVSQVKVPPNLRMAAHPGNEESVRIRTTSASRSPAWSARSNSIPRSGSTEISREATYFATEATCAGGAIP